MDPYKKAVSEKNKIPLWFLKHIIYVLARGIGNFKSLCYEIENSDKAKVESICKESVTFIAGFGSDCKLNDLAIESDLLVFLSRNFIYVGLLS